MLYCTIVLNDADVLAQVGRVVDVVVAIGLTFGVCVAVSPFGLVNLFSAFTRWHAL